MTGTMKSVVIGSTLLLMSAAANAQYRDRDDYYRGARGGYYNSGNIVDQVHYDIERALAMGYLSHGQYRTLQKAQEDLNDFQRSWNRGAFNKHELDEAIGRLQSVVDSRRLPYEMGARLQVDANRLRDFRASRGGYGYGGGYGYRRY